MTSPLLLRQSSRWFEFRSELGEFSEVLGGGGEEEFVTGTARPPQPKSTKFENVFRMGEQHLDLLAITPRGLAGIGVGNLKSHVGSIAGGGEILR